MWTAMIRYAWICGLAALLGACGGDDEAAVNTDPAPAVSAVIGPQGGTVDGPDGVQVVIPAGALSQPTTIGIARSSAGAPTPPAGNPPTAAIYEFTPHDLVFNAPVTLRMPVPNGTANADVLMASPGEDWQAVGATLDGNVASWQRNSFSWGLISFCSVPTGSTDPYPCVLPRGHAVANATPAAALARSTHATHDDFSGSAGSWSINQSAAVTLTLHYRAAPDCTDGAGSPGGRVKLLRWNPAASPRVVQTVFDGAVGLTPTPVTPPPGAFESGTGGPALRGVGSTTVDVSAHLTDAVNVFAFSFSCARPGRSMVSGGDLVTLMGPMPAPVGPFTIGGTITGLTGAGLVLQNNGGDDLAVVANATGFMMPSTVVNGTPYSIRVGTQPAGQTCTVQDGSGNASANVSNVQVACVGSGAPVPLVATAIAAGVSASLVVATDGTVWAWGDAVDPVTGGYTRSVAGATRPVQVQGLSGVKEVAVSGESDAFYALHTDGTVSAWGLNTAGQLGDRTTTTRPLPVKVLQDASTPMDEVCSIAAAANILLMARETGCSPGGRVVAMGPWIVGWFNNTTIGGDSSRPSPRDGAVARAVPGWPADQWVAQMSTTDASSTAAAVFFRTHRGDRYVWGFNGSNLLGAGISTPFAGGAGGPVTPQGAFWSGISRVELGRDFSVGHDEDGGLVAVGRNLEYQLGDGTNTSSTSLVRVSTLADVTDFSVGQVSAAAITNGELWFWGWDWNSNAAITLPTRVGTGSGFTKVSVADAHALAIGPRGEVYSWGRAFGGTLGRDGVAGVPAVVMRP